MLLLHSAPGPSWGRQAQLLMTQITQGLLILRHLTAEVRQPLPRPMQQRWQRPGLLAGPMTAAAATAASAAAGLASAGAAAALQQRPLAAAVALLLLLLLPWQ
jgi:hypothetical protein